MRHTANVTEHRVWDLPTRIFHWMLVLCVAALLSTGLWAGDQWYAVHVWSGYALAALLVMRLIWWVFGTGYSRFSSLVTAITQLPTFLPGLLRLRPQHYAGHNPAGSLMILMLMISLAGLAASGFMVEGGEEKRGILAGYLRFATGDAAHQIHAILAYMLIGLVVLHVAGVMFETVVQGMPLVRGMVTGNLPITPDMPGWNQRAGRPIAALVALVIVAIVTASIATLLARHPPLDVSQRVQNQQFETECSACHMAFPPTLLPRASWEKLMASLDDHFGEDASLPDVAAMEISAYLQANAAETSDSEASHRLSAGANGTVIAITQTPYWQQKHASIPVAVFAKAPINAKSNCQACHADAASGRFDDDQIKIPASTP